MGGVELAAATNVDVLVPSTALAQVWPGTAPQARLARALQHCVVAGFDAHAREVGILCGRARTSDICDAHVAIVAATHGDVLWTSDVHDLHRLIVAYGLREPVLARC